MNDSRKKMLEKVRAILAKTMDNGCTEGEAMAALSKARELMAAYEISEAELGHTQEAESAIVHKDHANDPYQIKRLLGQCVGRFTRCRSWNGHKAGYAVGFAGIESDVIFATWLLDTLQRFVIRELKTHQAQRRASGRACPRIVSVSFVAGCTTRIAARLKELTPADPVSAGNGNALVVSQRALITQAMAHAGIRLGKGQSYRPRVDGATYEAGKRAGDGAQFNRPVSGGGPLLLR